MRSSKSGRRSATPTRSKKKNHAATQIQFAAPAEDSPLRTDFNELGRQIVEVAKTLPGFAGVRLWQIAGSEAIACQEGGTLPPANKAMIEQIARGNASVYTEISLWAGVLKENHNVLGILELHGSGLLSPAAQRLALSFARIAEAALIHAGHRQIVQDLSAILEATRLLNSTLDLSELIDIILHVSTQLCGADRGTVFLLDRRNNEIWSLLGLGLAEQEIRLPLAKGIVGWVARHGVPLRSADAYTDPRFDREVDDHLGYHTRELLAFPIRNKDREIVGVLELMNKQTGPFSEADEKSLSYLSDHVAVALENAQLHREMLAKQRLESDLALARGVQQSLLPEQPPKLEGFEIAVAYAPSRMVGGDYYDFVRLKPESWLAVIADVEGKGMASALLMANLQAALHTLAVHVHALDHLVTSLNDMILSASWAQKLLSMFVAVIDHRNRVLHYINAGHPPPVVVRPDGSAVQLNEGGPVLGAFPDATFSRGRVQLGRGDIVAAYTDGITEAMDVHGEQYGFNRLLDVLRAERTAPAEQIVEKVLSQVDCFSRGGMHEDDRVILTLKVA